VFVDGALNSGDLGYADDNGRLHIAGRAKDLIIRSGHNIDPLMIEKAMTAHPAVALAAAVGMPDAYAGELPVCYVALRPGARATRTSCTPMHKARSTSGPRGPSRSTSSMRFHSLPSAKIYKPQLRCDVASRLVTRLVREQLALPEARVDVEEGGRRGMRVRVTLPSAAAASAPAVERELAGYLFEAKSARASELRCASPDVQSLAPSRSSSAAVRIMLLDHLGSARNVRGSSRRFARDHRRGLEVAGRAGRVVARTFGVDGTHQFQFAPGPVPQMLH
jgi:hypothetical protein